jgi:hypothetical protein
MAHVRKQIRDWLAANLTGSASAGERVYDQRALPLAKQGVPALLFSIQGEQVSEQDFEHTQQRIETLRVMAVVKGDSASAGDTLDTLGVFVEGRFSSNPTLGGIVKRYEYQGADFAFAGDGEKTLCTMAMRFVLQLFTERADPETAI